MATITTTCVTCGKDLEISAVTCGDCTAKSDARLTEVFLEIKLIHKEATRTDMFSPEIVASVTEMLSALLEGAEQ